MNEQIENIKVLLQFMAKKQHQNKEALLKSAFLKAAAMNNSEMLRAMFEHTKEDCIIHTQALLKKAIKFANEYGINQ